MFCIAFCTLTMAPIHGNNPMVTFFRLKNHFSYTDYFIVRTLSVSSKYTKSHLALRVWTVLLISRYLWKKRTSKPRTHKHGFKKRIQNWNNLLQHLKVVQSSTVTFKEKVTFFLVSPLFGLRMWHCSVSCSILKSVKCNRQTDLDLDLDLDLIYFIDLYAGPQRISRKAQRYAGSQIQCPHTDK